MALLGTAGAASPCPSPSSHGLGGAEHGARAKLWPAIRAGLSGLGLGAESVSQCRAAVLELPGEASAAIDRLRSHLRFTLRSATAQDTVASALREIEVGKRECYVQLLVRRRVQVLHLYGAV